MAQVLRRIGCHPGLATVSKPRNPRKKRFSKPRKPFFFRGFQSVNFCLIDASFRCAEANGMSQGRGWNSPSKRAAGNRSCRLIFHVFKSRGGDSTQSVTTKLRRLIVISELEVSRRSFSGFKEFSGARLRTLSNLGNCNLETKLNETVLSGGGYGSFQWSRPRVLLGTFCVPIFQRKFLYIYSFISPKRY